MLSDEPLRLARDERRELVARLADEGMSTRAIAPIVGASQRTVTNDVAEATEQNCSVEPDAPKPAPIIRTTTGLDGRERTTVSAGQVKKPQRRPLPDVARDAGWELQKAPLSGSSAHRAVISYQVS